MAGRVLRRTISSPLSVLAGNPNSVAVSLRAPAGTAQAAPSNIGLFTNAVVKFLIVAFVLFLVVRGINTIRNEQAAAQPA
jgi:large conductance mechanosensitive channel